jgi:segregation and condensation protein B
MLQTKIEAILFASTKPLSAKQMYNFFKKEGDVDVSLDAIVDALKKIAEEFNRPERGIHLLTNGEDFQFVSNVEFSGLVKKFLKEDLTGELTPASLETLSVIVYRGPISKVDLEEIRGVNCTMILRNLMIRGLIEESHVEPSEQLFYRATTDFVKYLGVTDLSQLPDFDKLHSLEITNRE